MKTILFISIALLFSSCGYFKNNPDSALEEAIEMVAEEAFEIELELTPED